MNKVIHIKVLDIYTPILFFLGGLNISRDDVWLYFRKEKLEVDHEQQVIL